MFKNLAFASLMLVLLAPGAARAAEVVDSIVAVVNGEIITQFDLNRELAPTLTQFQGRELGPAEDAQVRLLQKRLLDRLVDDILVLQEAKRLDFKIPDNEVEGHIRQLKQKNGITEEQFSAQLRLEGLSLADYKKRVREQMLIQRLMNLMVTRKVVVTDVEVERYFEEHKSQYVREKKVRLGLILFEPGVNAAEVAAKVRGGGLSFAEAAAQYSKGPGAEQGGDLGELRWSDLAPDWKKALEGLEPGQASEPFSLGNRSAMLELKSSVSGDAAAFEAVRDEIKELLIKPRYETVYKEYMQKLRDKAIVEIKM